MHTEGAGWASEGMTAAKTARLLGELKTAAKAGTGPATLKERRDQATADRAAQEKDGLTFGEYFRETYFPTATLDKKAASAEKEEQHFRLWLEPVLGRVPMRQLAPLDIERVKKNLMDAGRSARLIEYVLSTFRVVWNHARRSGIVAGDSPSKAVAKPKVNNKRIRFLSTEEADRLLNHLADGNHWLHDIVLLSLDCGLRAKELFDLQWSCINLEGGTIFVKDSKAGDRFVPVTDRAADMLRNREPGKASSPVFQNANGERFNAVSYSFNLVADKLGFNDGLDKRNRKERLTFHSLRHTYASWLVKAGTDLYTVQKLLGHTTIAMTERYAHLAPDSLQAAVEKLNQQHRERKSADIIPMTG